MFEISLCSALSSVLDVLTTASGVAICRSSSRLSLYIYSGRNVSNTMSENKVMHHLFLPFIRLLSDAFLLCLEHMCSMENDCSRRVLLESYKGIPLPEVLVTVWVLVGGRRVLWITYHLVNATGYILGVRAERQNYLPLNPLDSVTLVNWSIHTMSLFSIPF